MKHDIQSATVRTIATVLFVVSAALFVFGIWPDVVMVVAVIAGVVVMLSLPRLRG